MTKAIINNNQTITSLELLEQINFFRKEEGKKTKTQHYDLLKIIRSEFEEEIHEGKISCGSYKDKQNQNRPMFELTTAQAKQVLVRESKFVRKAVIHKLEELENGQPKQKILSTSEFLLEQAKLMVEYGKRLDDIENRVDNLEKNNNFIGYNQTCITVSEFAEMKHLSSWEYIPRTLGAKACFISKKLNLPIRKIYKHNIKGGKVKGRYFINTYHIKALEQAFAELKQKEIDSMVVTCTRPFKEV